MPTFLFTILLDYCFLVQQRAGMGVLDEPYSAKPTQLSSQKLSIPARQATVPAYVDWRACTRLLRWVGLAHYKVRLKLPPY